MMNYLRTSKLISTSISPDHKTQNHMDYVAISKKWSTSVLNVRNRRGAKDKALLRNTKDVVGKR